MLETKKFDSLESLQGWLDDNAGTIGSAREFTLITEHEPRSSATTHEPSGTSEPQETAAREAVEEKTGMDTDDMAWTPTED